jgi:hypothetical protein
MSQARKRRRARRRSRSFVKCLQEFLTPQLWKQVRYAGRTRQKPRWNVHCLLFVLCTTTWCCGDSLPERFEAGRSFYVICHEKRKRPGRTFEGFQKAVARLPMPVLRTFASAMRQRIFVLLGERMLVHGFRPLGCDGSRVECPRSEELERRLGTYGKAGSAPTVWHTALVHLTLGVPWAWRWGKGGKASERNHLRALLCCLPALALVVCDAGYVGYDLTAALMFQEVSFLIRLSSNAKLYTLEQVPLEQFREGIVYYWPDTARNAGRPPLQARLIRVEGRKGDVWLLTNVEDSQRLPRDVAAYFYRCRWESEGFFRTYKRTLKKVKLFSRTVRTVHREAEAAMLATQLLLAQAALSQQPAMPGKAVVPCSPRRALLEVRREINGSAPRGSFAERLADARRERRARTTPKQKREWPRRKDHRPPAPPKILKLTEQLKAQAEIALQKQSQQAG